MSAALLNTLSTFVALTAQYEALALAQSVVTAQSMTLATMAWLTAFALALIRWEAIYRAEIRT